MRSSLFTLILLAASIVWASENQTLTVCQDNKTRFTVTVNDGSIELTGVNEEKSHTLKLDVISVSNIEDKTSHFLPLVQKTFKLNSEPTTGQDFNTKLGHFVIITLKSGEKAVVTTDVFSLDLIGTTDACK